MSFTLNYGDDFERRNAAWIKATFPAYEAVWSQFIAHDGKGKPLPMSGLTSELQKDRVNFMQAHYSAMVSCFHLENVAKKIDASYGKVAGGEVIDVQGLLTAFFAFVGNICDQMSRIDIALDLHDALVRNFWSFFQMRNAVLHGPRIPFELKEGEIRIPPPSQAWDDKEPWSKANPKDFVSLHDFCESVKDHLFNEIRGGYGLIEGGCKKAFGSARLITPQSVVPPAAIGSFQGVPYYALSGQYVP